MRIRLIEKSDVTRVTLLAEELHKLSRFERIPFDVAKVSSLFHSAIEHPDRIFCRVAVDEFGMIVGGMLGELAEFYFSDHTFAFEYAVYITKDSRGAYTAVRLINEFVLWAKECGASEAHFGVIAGINDEIGKAIYEKLGLEDMGRLYRKVFNNG